MKRAGGNLSGDPKATREAILALVDADDPPLRVLLGEGLLPSIEESYEARLDIWRQWEPLSKAAQGSSTG